MPAPYTIRIFVADGDPEGVRIIDRFNWTGKGFFFPRSQWPEVRKRAEFKFAGVYILFGDALAEDALPARSARCSRRRRSWTSSDDQRTRRSRRRPQRGSLERELEADR